jgi:serine/threonine protein kinase
MLLWQRWRTTMLLLWKRGPLQRDTGPIHGDCPIVQLICEFASPPWPQQPMQKLSVHLIRTYTGINTAYYAAKRKWQAQQTQPNTGNFKWSESARGLVLNGRYELIQEIGHGAFGVVMKATDLQTCELVAIKIIKAKKAYSQQARREIK